MKPVKVLYCRFLFAFLALTVQKHNSCLPRFEDLANSDRLRKWVFSDVDSLPPVAFVLKHPLPQHENLVYKARAV